MKSWKHLEKVAQVASMSAKRPKKHYWREIEAKREELELAREFAL